MEVKGNQEETLGKLLRLVKSGQLENIELALEIGQSHSEFQEKLEAYRKFYWVVFGEKATRITPAHLLALTNAQKVSFFETGLAHLPQEVDICINIKPFT